MKYLAAIGLAIIGFGLYWVQSEIEGVMKFVAFLASMFFTFMAIEQFKSDENGA